MSPPRTGDTIFHHMTKEKWVVAFADERSNLIASVGFPPVITRLSRCEVLERCSDEVHNELVEEYRWTRQWPDDDVFNYVRMRVLDIHDPFPEWCMAL
jgi:hypothetical protein